MSSLFGQSYCKVNDLNLEYSIVEPNFLIPAEIMHESVLTGTRTYSKKENYSEFSVMVYLFQYADANTKASAILALENTLVTFTFSVDLSLIHI